MDLMAFLFFSVLLQRCACCGRRGYFLARFKAGGTAVAPVAIFERFNSAVQSWSPLLQFVLVEKRGPFLMQEQQTHNSQTTTGNCGTAPCYLTLQFGNLLPNVSAAESVVRGQV